MSDERILRNGVSNEIVEIISFLKLKLPNIRINEQDVLESFAELFSNYVVTTDKTKEVLLKRLILVLYIANDEKELDIMDLMKNELYRELFRAMEKWEEHSTVWVWDRNELLNKQNLLNLKKFILSNAVYYLERKQWKKQVLMLSAAHYLLQNTCAHDFQFVDKLITNFYLSRNFVSNNCNTKLFFRYFTEYLFVDKNNSLVLPPHLEAKIFLIPFYLNITKKIICI